MLLQQETSKINLVLEIIEESVRSSEELIE